MTRIALLEDNTLSELYYEKVSNTPKVGDIYCGVVEEVALGLNAAFLDIGAERNAFLQYIYVSRLFDAQQNFFKSVMLGKSKKNLESIQINYREAKKTDLQEMFQKGQKVIAQVCKEPILTKGASLTTTISLAGYYLVLIPFYNRVQIPKKIKDAKEREHLRKKIRAILPSNFGAVVRTVARDKTTQELTNDIERLMRRWKDILNNLPNVNSPKKILGEAPKIEALLKNSFSKDLKHIVVDDEKYIQQLVSTVDATRISSVKLHKGKRDVFNHFGLEKQIKLLMGTSVTLKSGAYLIIEHTEAMHVIDINSGPRAKDGKNQEETAFEVNEEAALEICRQLRLRDMGGIIVVDFINMKDQENKKALYQLLRENLQKDKAKYTILPLTKLGLMQITRQKLRPQLEIDNSETCPTCQGKKQISSSLTVVEEIKRKMTQVAKVQPSPSLTLFVHPYVFAFLTKGLFSIQFRFYLRFFKWIKMESDASLGILQYYFFDKKKQKVVKV